MNVRGIDVVGFARGPVNQFTAPTAARIQIEHLFDIPAIKDLGVEAPGVVMRRRVWLFHLEPVQRTSVIEMIFGERPRHALDADDPRAVGKLTPALAEVEAEISALTEMRAIPTGTIRITTSKHAATTLLWPKLRPMLRDYPDVHLELSLDNGLADVVSDRFDAGVRLGEAVAKDMIAVPIGPDVRMVVVGAPSYLDRHQPPAVPQDLAQHRCINQRTTTVGGFYAWEFEKDGRDMRVRVDGQLAFNDEDIIVQAAIDGYCLAFVMEDYVRPALAAGQLVPVLKDWCPAFAGYHLYYPSRRQPTAAFSLLVKALRHPRE